MQFKTFINITTTFVEIVLTVIILLMFTAFALRPTETVLLTNSLILLAIMAELYIVNVLMNIYEKLGMRKRR